MQRTRFDRRALVRFGAGSVATAAASATAFGSIAGARQDEARPAATPPADVPVAHHPGVMGGDVDTEAMGYDPMTFVRTFDDGQLTALTDGVMVREFQLTTVDKQIEIAPGLFFPAWTYNGQVPGPTLRANEGERLRIHVFNESQMPHTVHFHGIHSAFQDGVSGIGRGDIMPGESHIYEFDAKPFGCHLYHCHTAPLAFHIQRGLYGAFIINPDPVKRGDAAKARHPDYPESAAWQELVMVMNAFDTNDDEENEVYAVNTVAFHYMKHPIPIDRTRPVRIYLVNITEFHPIYSFHLHANFFDYYDTVTTLEPTLRTVDTIVQAQAQRGILEFSFADHEPGIYTFHAHITEFGDLGWMSAFDVR